MSETQQLLKYAVAASASDLHISAGSPIMVRVHGAMRKVDGKCITQDVAENLINQLLNDAQIDQLTRENEIDFSIENPEGRFRANVFQQRQGLGAVFRIIPERIPTMEELHLPKTLREMIDLENGLILVTGPTGSGKSTSLASMINYVNENKSGHIITIEDPIEFIHKSNKCVVNQRQIGTNTQSFANALRSALREDPDYILVGEMRDLETISLALTAAETGHLVFGTLHTSSAPKTITRIIDIFPSDQKHQIRLQVAESLRGVVAQRLYPRKDNTGRIAAFELMIANQAIRNLIREEKTFQIDSVIQTGRQFGMQSLEQSKRQLISEGVLSPEYLEERNILC
ncbi:type IV pilus twitching motility protein PilT [candidate division WOR-3 bacterium]|nr:type IV pilus twitching motility protein PilT [candidate division WOR-3 bacterium]